MKTLHTPEQLFHHADELIQLAENEQSRSEEDTVTHLICTNARLSIHHLLTAFLLQHNAPILPPASIASLQHQCQAIDGRFDTLDLDHMPCRYEPVGKRYCLERDEVDACLVAAKEVRSLVVNAMPAY